MSNLEKLEQKICETAEAVYAKYQHEAYLLSGCPDKYSKEFMQDAKLLIALRKYQECGVYIECELT